ncbi:hypothetical protein LTR09_007208 [Extremus antarcticus]|uniref:SET domain-containing protein n=1 Tax=Extremus antarcticus TaxID=702011 RepID=A0AAJ0DJG0_9PEZI|nr:hypothetical protein LTR09_007208 [Extremus antarcticus]
MQREFKEPLFTDRKIQGEPGLGYGVFATKKIAEGILILAATPEFYTEYFPYTGIRRLNIAQTADLKRYSQECVDGNNGDRIYNLNAKEAGKVVAIFHNNAYIFKDGTGRQFRSMVTSASRFNHPCTPNAVAFWNDISAI